VSVICGFGLSINPNYLFGVQKGLSMSILTGRTFWLIIPSRALSDTLLRAGGLHLGEPPGYAVILVDLFQL
jgi:hypothetical protein